MVAAELGKAFRPERVVFVQALPKTRSAKIVRRAVRAAATGADPGDLSSVENPETLAAITAVTQRGRRAPSPSKARDSAAQRLRRRRQAAKRLRPGKAGPVYRSGPSAPRRLRYVLRRGRPPAHTTTAPSARSRSTARRRETPSTSRLSRRCAHELAAAATDPSVRCIVLAGAGKAFCAGADVKAWS